MIQDDVIIVAAARTPQGRFKGQLASFAAPQLGSLANHARHTRTKIRDVAEQVVTRQLQI